MAITDLTRIETSIRLAGSNSLGCGFLYLAGGASVPAGMYPEAAFCAVRQLEATTDTTLTNIVSKDATDLPGTTLLLSKAQGNMITYMNFSSLRSDKNVLLYYRCR